MLGTDGGGASSGRAEINAKAQRAQRRKGRKTRNGGGDFFTVIPTKSLDVIPEKFLTVIPANFLTVIPAKAGIHSVERPHP